LTREETQNDYKSDTQLTSPALIPQLNIMQPTTYKRPLATWIFGMNNFTAYMKEHAREHVPEIAQAAPTFVSRFRCL
jgi:hypothetical protein